MSDFAPSASRSHGSKTVRKEYPSGVAGVAMSLQQMAQRICEGRTDPDVRGWAGDVLHAAGRPQGAFAQASALLDALRRQTVYAPDPVGVEYMTSAAGTLCLRPGLCVRAADCDDLTIALGAACLSIGIPVRVIKQTFGSGDQEHVLLEAQAENGSWFPMDPSTQLPCGQKHFATSEFRMDPTQPSLVGLSGRPDSEFVGIGNPGFGGLPPRRLGRSGGRLAPRVIRGRKGIGAPTCCSECASTRTTGCCSASTGGCSVPTTGAQRGVGQASSATSSTSSASSSTTAATNTSDAGGGGSNFSASSAYDQPTSDLQSLVTSIVGQGDASLASANYSAAVTSYQQAGNAGATQVGPEIDLAGAPNVTQPFTQEAWQLNQGLASITASSATQSDAENAQTIAQQIVSLYVQAIGAGQTALDQGNLGTPPPPAGGSPLGVSNLVGAIGLGLAAGAVWHVWLADLFRRAAR